MERTEQSRPCTAVPQLTELTARPAAPTQPLTAATAPWPTDADVDRALGAYGRAFGEDLPRGAA
jgi:hypothetical protein